MISHTEQKRWINIIVLINYKNAKNNFSFIQIMEEEKKDANFLLKDFSENTTTHGPKNIVSAVRVWAKEIVFRSSDWWVFIN